VHLRLEDHDRIRCRPEYERALLEDLDWLGFVPDSGRAPLHRQSDRTAPFEDALARLRDQGRVYTCRCSRREIGGDCYPGTCRDAAVPEGPGTCLRARLDAGIVTAHDLRLGLLEQDPGSQCGDVVIRDRDGHWTYQLAVTVDDIVDDITLVIRGEDLLSSTGRQVALAQLLGRQAPATYLHHPVVRHASGEKLSKAAGDAGIRELRERGVTAAAVIGRAAAMAGLRPTPDDVHAAEVSRLFDGKVGSAG